MKTTITTLSLLLIAFLGYAQNGPINFEPGGEGADWTWTVFENDSNPDLEIIANPDPTGANTSATVAQFTALETGNPWAGCESQQVVDLGNFEWDSTNRTVTIMVWKSVISDVGIKFDSETGWSEGEIKVANTVVNEWEELTFDFSNAMNPPPGEGQLSRIVIFPDFDLDGRTQDNVVYFDNVTFEEGGGGGDPADEPTVAAPDPEEDADDVISLFSGVYTDVDVDTWRTPWSSGDLEDIEIDGNATKKYTNLDFVGVETTGDNLVDASEMEFFHIDVWTPNMETIRIKLVDFGPDGEFDGGDDTEHELVFTDLPQGEWNSLQLPLEDFEGLAARSNLAQYILSGLPTGQGTLYVDNVYFSKTGGGNPDEPAVAAPDPTEDEANVISMFSGVYTDVDVDTWRTPWSSGDLEDIEVQGNPTKKYTNLDFVGVETTGDNLIDATEMDFFHIDLWTPNMDTIRIKLVDWGPDGQFDGGDDTEHELVFTDLPQGEWNSLQLPLEDFEGLAARSNLAQYILSGLPTGQGTLYVDNVYFSKTGGGNPDEPTVAAPDPTEDEANVISMFSGVYTDVDVDTWRTPWSSGDLEDIEIQGNATKKYTNLDFVGVETTGDNLIDATEMDFFHIDLWTPNMDTIRIKLVDWGPDGQFDGGDDTEHELVFTDLPQGEWNSLQLPLEDFEGLAARSNLAQYILSGLPTGQGTLYVDNVYFSKTGGGNPDEPAVAAPDPTEDEANVISMFSGVYTNVDVDTWRTPWSQGDLEDIEIQGNATKKYTNLDFVGVETTGDNLIDATEMDFFHIDLWTPNMDTIRVKLVDWGPDGQFDGGDDTEHELIFTDLPQGEWNSLQLPLEDFEGLAARNNLAQYILSGLPVGEGTLYVDNVYFSKMSTSVANPEPIDARIYPNPTSDFVILETKSPVTSCTIYAMNGQRVLEKMNPGNKLDVSRLGTGLYIIEIETKEGMMRQRLIIQ